MKVNIKIDYTIEINPQDWITDNEFFGISESDNEDAAEVTEAEILERFRDSLGGTGDDYGNDIIDFFDGTRLTVTKVAD